ncbi:MAG: cytochrome b/b6 domain-containing protein [Anaerolineales bacterium]|jgi:cytochrome b561|nr:cytochrome b/b6 domain-containing protein [Anaerolineales bacterium]
MSETTTKRYHPVHVVIHWLMALLVFLMLGVGKGVMPGVSPEDPQKVGILQSHAYIGGAIAVLLVARLVLRYTTRRPAPADAGSAFLNFLGKAVHLLLYLMLIGMAVSGFGMFQQANLSAVFSGAQPYPSNFFDFLPRIGHGLTSWLLLALIALHVGAALFHQFIRKDNLLARMWFGK